jgi:hypothetical protein
MAAGLRGIAKGLVGSVSMAAAVLVAAQVALRAISLLVVGETRTHVAEVPPGTPLPPPTVVHVPYPPAVIPLAGAALLLVGLLARKLALAWSGVAVLSVFSVLFVFGQGGAFLPAAGLVLLLLILITITVRQPR